MLSGAKQHTLALPDSSILYKQQQLCVAAASLDSAQAPATGDQQQQQQACALLSDSTVQEAGAEALAAAVAADQQQQQRQQDQELGQEADVDAMQQVSGRQAAICRQDLSHSALLMAARVSVGSPAGGGTRAELQEAVSEGESPHACSPAGAAGAASGGAAAAAAAAAEAAGDSGVDLELGTTSAAQKQQPRHWREQREQRKRAPQHTHFSDSEEEEDADEDVEEAAQQHGQQQLAEEGGEAAGGGAVAGGRRKRQRQGLRPIYIHGNYRQYYGYRLGNAFEQDPRLCSLDRRWFTRRRCLDVGCNAGVVTLALAARFGAASMVGVDIDLALIKRAIA